MIATDRHDSDIAAIGVDIGNTNHTAALVSGAGEALEILRCRTDRNGGPDALLMSLGALLPELEREAGERGLRLTGIGVGFGGPVDLVTGRTRLSHQNAGWDDIPLRDRLETLTGLPIALDNDANAGGLGEARFGAGRGHRDLVYYNLGTGIGGAVILGGRLRHGAASIAGELGHTTVRPDGPLCTCGQKGCLESLASGTAIARRMEELQIPWQGRVASADDFFPMVQAGHPDAIRLLEQVVESLAISIRNILHILNPEMVIIGGGVSKGGDLLLEPLRNLVRQLTLEAAYESCEIVGAQLGYDAGVIGAAALVL